MLITILLLCLIPSITWGQTRVIEVHTISSQSYPPGETLTGNIAIPAQTTGRYSVSLPCAPNLNVTVRLEVIPTGAGLGSFRRNPQACKTSTIRASWHLASLSSGTPLRVRLTNHDSVARTIELTIRLEKFQ